MRVERNGLYLYAAWTDPDLGRCRKSLGRADQLDPEKIKRALDELSAGREVGNAPATLRQMYEKFLECHEISGKAENTIDAYQSTIFRLIKAEDGERHAPISAGKAVSFKWYQELRGLSRHSVAHHVRNARAIWNWATRMGWVTFNPFNAFPSSAGKVATKATQVTDEDIGAMLRHDISLDLKLMIGLCAYAGLRRSEALRFRLDTDYVRDFDARTQLDVDYIVVRAEAETTKTGYRKVKVDDRLRVVIACCKACGINGVSVPPGSLSREIKAAWTRAGRQGVLERPCQAMRQWRARSWRTEYPEHVVDSWLGHSLAVAREHYVEPELSLYSLAE